MSDMEPEPTKNTDLRVVVAGLSSDERNIYDKVLMKQRIEGQQEGTGRNVSVEDRLQIIAGIKSGQIKEPPATSHPQVKQENTGKYFDTFIENSLPNGDRVPEDET